MAKLISFIVPAYNEETELPETLRAIRGAAEQNRCEYEIVVVDDASSDATAELARQLGARVVPIARRQIAAARNAGAQRARGDVFIFVDADTYIRAEHIDGVQQALRQGYAGGGARLEIEGKMATWAKLFFAVFSLFYFRLLNLGAGGFLFTTRRNFSAIGGFNEAYFAAEEVFFTRALRKLGRFKLLPEPAVTSGRKLRLYSASQIWRCLLGLVFAGPGALTSRRKLHLWYGGERERLDESPLG